MTDPRDTAMIGPDFLYTSPDGREAFVIFAPEGGVVFIATDIHGQGAPFTAVAFSAAKLRQIADKLDELAERGHRGRV